MQATPATKKVTKATFKSFITKNADRLMVKVRSQFDGMTDCVVPCASGFVPAQKDTEWSQHTLGIRGVWLVGGSRNWFTPYNENGFTGIKVTNCCGSCIVAIPA